MKKPRFHGAFLVEKMVRLSPPANQKIGIPAPAKNIYHQQPLRME
jgi:hypothetical protein